MLGVIFDQSKVALLTQLLAGGPFAGSNCKMMLFDTLTSLDHADTLSTLTAHEAAFTGYARQTVSGWGTPALMADFHARAQAATVTFSNSGGSPSSTITGWALVDDGAGKVMQAGLYDTPFAIGASEDYLTTPFWTLTGEISSEP